MHLHALPKVILTATAVALIVAAATGAAASASPPKQATITLGVGMDPSAVTLTTCSLHSAGARFSGYRVGRRNLFEIKSGKVSAVHVSSRPVVAARSARNC